MSESTISPTVIVDVARQYSRGVRIVLSCIVSSMALLYVREKYHWPDVWPSPTPGANVGIAALAILGFLVFAWMNPVEKIQTDKIPEKRPVVDGAIKYFLVGRAG